jgi:hypothetical protein
MHQEEEEKDMMMTNDDDEGKMNETRWEASEKIFSFRGTGQILFCKRIGITDRKGSVLC